MVGSSYLAQAMTATASAPVGQPPSATVHVPVNDGQGGWIYQTIPPTGTATTTGPLGTGQNMTANAGMNTIPAATVPTTMPEPQTTYPAQTLPTSGIGYGASQAIPQVQTAPTTSAGQMYASETPIGASTMGGSYPTQAAAPASTLMAQPQGNTVVIQPFSNGRGGWTYTMNGQPIPSTNVAMGAVPPMPSYASMVPVGLQSSTGFFSRLFGDGRRAQSVAPQSVYPTYPSTHYQNHHSLKPVQYSAARPRYHRRRSIL